MAFTIMYCGRLKPLPEHVLPYIALITYHFIYNLMGSRGKIITASALAGLTLALALVFIINLSDWLPQDTAMVIITDDYSSLLDESLNIQNAIHDSLWDQYQSMLNGTITTQEYSVMAQTALDQTTAQIRTLVTAGAPPQWAERYSQAIESLRAFNSMIRETVVHADILERGDRDDDTVQRVADLRQRVAEHADLAEISRP